MRSGTFINRKLWNKCKSREKYNAQVRKANYLIRKRYLELISKLPGEIMKEIREDKKVQKGKNEKET
ncbi:hypothetical protein COU37_02820 [Candidatus Micrarchaeota archaeon CG10_big_fil_rev_8_21_14_0_10_45_29]|nr:MAG: hypothetical protein COU37_02820 [Candidatus Micrarchaeota archaeon CG10_big_fil_rev_8_21_14_0_10_45_29]